MTKQIIQTQDDANKSGMMCSLLPIGIFIVNSEKLVVEANPYIFKYFKKEFEEPGGRRFGNIFSCSYVHGTHDLCGGTDACNTCPLRNGVSQVLDEGIELSEVELQHNFVINDRQASKWFTVNATRFFSGDEPHALVAFTDITERKNIESDLVMLGITDSLTGVYNRRYIMQQLEGDLLRRSNDVFPLSLAMIDLDDFKQVNDQHGHQVGDNVLIKLIEVIQECTRETDHIGRYGGDEFLVIFPNLEADTAKKVLERVQKTYAALNIESMQAAPSFSAGVLQICRSDIAKNKVSDFIRSVDMLLYSAKEQGKGRIAVGDNLAG